MTDGTTGGIPNNINDVRKFTMVRDTMLQFPELYLEVFVVGDKSEQAAFAEMFVRGRCTKVDLPEDADVVVFTGGVDVNPTLYGEEAHDTTHFSQGRDDADMEVYSTCLQLGIPMFGVCRGAQFLHVMNGGRLYQDVDNHNGDHVMYDTKAGRLVQKVSSVHHQMCIKNPEMEVLGTSSAAKNRWRNPKENDTGNQSDVEAFFYRETCCLGVQGHPEYRGYHEFMKWTMQKIHEYVNENTDITLNNGKRRMKEDLMKQRELNWAGNLAANNTVVLN